MSDRQQRLARVASKEVARAEARLDELYAQYLTGGHEVCFNDDMSNAPATLATTERGVTRSIFDLRVGDYIWHSGAFRRVTAADGMTVRMGRYVLRSTCTTVEGAPS